MTKHYETTVALEATPDEVLAVVTSEAFLVARDKVQGALEVVVEERARTQERLDVEVRTTRYARGLTGIDRSKTEEATITYAWDLAARRASWVHRGVHGDRVKVTGTIAIEPSDGGARLVDTMTVTVKYPVVGGKIETLVIDEMKKGFAEYERVVRDHVARG